MADGCLLVGDIGGTNVRFALANEDGAEGYANELSLDCADYGSPEEAINAYLQEVQAPAPRVICLAAAGPVINGEVQFTNNSWRLIEENLRETFRTEHVRLLNDFEAIAYSLPLLSGADCINLGPVLEGGLGGGNYTAGVLGPGTGLGAAGLVSHGDATLPLVTEAGHVGFAPETPLQLDLLVQLRQRYDRVSDERLVSGGGLENIYWGLGRIQNIATSPLSAGEIFSHCRKESHMLAVQAVDLFYEILGQVAGNLALTLGAYQGIYLAGGMVKRCPEMIARSRFREGFENKGRHGRIMRTIPTLLVQHKQPGLLGASSVASRLLLMPA